MSGPRINDRIRITPIRLIDENGEMVGVVDTDEARRRAAELGLDLVEIAADVRPPVVRIMDYGKFRYEQSKKDRAGRAKSKVSEMKEVRLGRSMKIDPHDVEIRVSQARRFLIERAIVWNLTDTDGTLRGQAATFAEWTPLAG